MRHLRIPVLFSAVALLLGDEPAAGEARLDACHTGGARPDRAGRGDEVQRPSRERRAAVLLRERRGLHGPARVEQDDRLHLRGQLEQIRDRLGRVHGRRR